MGFQHYILAVETTVMIPSMLSSSLCFSLWSTSYSLASVRRFITPPLFMSLTCLRLSPFSPSLLPSSTSLVSLESILSSQFFNLPLISGLTRTKSMMPKIQTKSFLKKSLVKSLVVLASIAHLLKTLSLSLLLCLLIYTKVLLSFFFDLFLIRVLFPHFVLIEVLKQSKTLNFLFLLCFFSLKICFSNDKWRPG